MLCRKYQFGPGSGDLFGFFLGMGQAEHLQLSLNSEAKLSSILQSWGQARLSLGAGGD